MPDKFNVSVIICTCNRPRSLINAIDSILLQKKLPSEVVIIDDSDDKTSELYVKSRENEFNNLGIDLIYYKNYIRKGLANARNIGVKKCKSEIVLFIDDDVMLDPLYIYELVTIYEDRWPDIKGAQGYIMRKQSYDLMSSFIRSISKVFYYSYDEYNFCRVLPSTNPTYPLNLKKIIPCQWLSGCNQSYVRSVFDEFMFDENLIQYSFKEDMDFSYRIWKKYPNQLFITPKAKCFHDQQLKRPDSKKRSFMKEIYSMYFFYKNIDQTFINKVIYMFSKIGNLLYLLSSPFMPGNNYKTPKIAINELKYFIIAQILCIKYRKNIKILNIDVINNLLLENY